MRRRTALVSAVLTLLVAVSACTSGDNPKPLPAGVRAGGHLTIGIMQPRSIAPWLTTTVDPYGTLVVQTMCDQILSIDPRTTQLKPAIVAKWHYQSAKLITLKLRKGLRFPDGSGVRTADIQESIARAARSDVASPVADVLEPIVGATQLGAMQSADETDPRVHERLAGVGSPDPGSLEVLLVENGLDAFRVLAHPVTSVVSSKAFNKDPLGLERKPDCVGPYQLAEAWQPGADVIRLVRAKTYNGQNLAYTAAGRGLADSIDFRIFPDREAIYAAYQAGEVDVAYVPAAKLADARQRFATDLLQVPSPTMEMIGLPTTKPPFDNPLVRLALSAAIDREAVARAVPARLHPVTQFIPPTLGAPFDDPDKVACRFTTKPTAQVQLAQTLLAEAGVVLSGTTIKLAFNDEFDNRAFVEAVAKQWEAALGLHVELVPTPWDRLVGSARSTGGIVDPFRVSWNPEVSNPSAYLKPLFHTKSIQADNWSRFTLRAFDRILDEQANKKIERADRADGLLAAQNVVCISMPMIPVAQGGFAYLVRQQKLGSAAETFTDRASGRLLVRELFTKSA